jgi:hypothetical protein
MIEVANVADWRGKDLLDRGDARIGRLGDVYVDTETEEPLFGSVKGGVITKHLTFVPLRGAVAAPNWLRVVVSKEQVKKAPNIAPDGELDAEQEHALYDHYGMTYEASATASGRRLAKR